METDLDQLRASLLRIVGRVARQAEENHTKAEAAQNLGVRHLLQGVALAQLQEVDHLERLIAQCEELAARQPLRRRGAATGRLAASRNHRGRAAEDGARRA